MEKRGTVLTIGLSQDDQGRPAIMNWAMRDVPYSYQPGEPYFGGWHWDELKIVTDCKDKFGEEFALTVAHMITEQIPARFPPSQSLIIDNHFERSAECPRCRSKLRWGQTCEDCVLDLVITGTLVENSTEKDLGKLVGLVVRRMQGRCNPQLVSDIIKKRLVSS